MRKANRRYVANVCCPYCSSPVSLDISSKECICKACSTVLQGTGQFESIYMNEKFILREVISVFPKGDFRNEYKTNSLTWSM